MLLCDMTIISSYLLCGQVVLGELNVWLYQDSTLL